MIEKPKCRTCGGSPGHHVPSMFDPAGIGDPGHKVAGYIPVKEDGMYKVEIRVNDKWVTLLTLNRSSILRLCDYGMELAEEDNV